MPGPGWFATQGLGAVRLCTLVPSPSCWTSRDLFTQLSSGSLRYPLGKDTLATGCFLADVTIPALVGTCKRPASVLHTERALLVFH